MKVSSMIDLDSGYIHYAYDTVENKHHVRILAHSADADPYLHLTKDEGSAGHVINALAPHRDNEHVRELIAWLAR